MLAGCEGGGGLEIEESGFGGSFAFEVWGLCESAAEVVDSIQKLVSKHDFTEFLSSGEVIIVGHRNAGFVSESATLGQPIDDRAQQCRLCHKWKQYSTSITIRICINYSQLTSPQWHLVMGISKSTRCMHAPF
jgi:hypothetical protein